MSNAVPPTSVVYISNFATEVAVDGLRDTCVSEFQHLCAGPLCDTVEPLPPVLLDLDKCLVDTEPRRIAKRPTGRYSGFSNCSVFRSNLGGQRMTRNAGASSPATLD